jgi:hypothetical protein
VVTVSSYTENQRFDGALSVVSSLGEPETPAQLKQGLALDSPCVDLAQLRRWHRQGNANIPTPAGNQPGN